MDVNFYTALEELNKNKVAYWVCHGSLLGLTRDGDLIPWDHDIDIAVWHGEYTHGYIIQIFESMGFKWNQQHPDGSLSFERSGGRSIDVNFYTLSEASRELACCLHRVPKSKLTSLLEKLAHDRNYTGPFQFTFRFLNLFKIFFVPMFKLLDKAGLVYIERGYTTPRDLLVSFIALDYYGVSCKVPKDFEAINSYIYGEDWLVPKENYNWMTDSPSVVEQET